MFEEIEKEIGHEIKNIYFRGIGGSSMSGIAEALFTFKYNISGSDDAKSSNTEKLEKLGIDVYIGKDPERLKNADLVIYTSAIKKDDEELLMAEKLNIPIIERGVALGLILKKYKNTIGVSGTNGKTTTTSMISCIFLQAKKDPSIHIGAYLENINASTRVGASEYYIFEACEYKKAFLNFSHEVAVILNVDIDHLDYYKNFENIKKAFEKYALNTKKNGYIVMNAEDEPSNELRKKLEKEIQDKDLNLNIVTFGIDKKANVMAKNILYERNKVEYDLVYNDVNLGKISLNVLGKVNVLNSLAAIATGLIYKLDFEDIKKGLANFFGADRRFQYIGKINEASVYTDYAHNPSKIKGLSEITKQANKKTWIVFQPHTFSRTKMLFDEFVEALNRYDNIILTEIYPAREENIYNISSKDIVDKLIDINREKADKNILFIKDYDTIKKFLKENVKKDEIVLIVGAGNIISLADKIKKQEK